MRENTQAVILLTARFSKQGKDDVIPLTALEWGRLVRRLHDCDIEPGAFFKQDPSEVLENWRDRTITPERIRRLFERSAAMALALDKWLRTGLWVMTYYDADYPSLLKSRLNEDCPPVIFGCGNRKLLNQGGIAVIGSRNASGEDLAYTQHLSRHIALQGASVISGGARGVDEFAMLSALENDGTAVGILADSLLSSSTSKKYRQYLMRDDLVLISTFYPEAKFDVGNAMNRNKYIYCLADSAIVVAASEGKGGTWNGAIENLKREWVPLWVKPSDDLASGNALLVQKGACWLPSGKLSIELLKNAPFEKKSKDMPSLFDTPSNIKLEDHPVEKTLTAHIVEQVREDESVYAPSVGNSLQQHHFSFYELFLRRFEQIARDSAFTSDELCAIFEIQKSQLADWMKRASEEGKVRKLVKPVRYQWQYKESRQCKLFSGDANNN